MADQPTRIALENLAAEHYTVLQLAMSKILSTFLATETFAQIVDGLPTREVYLDYYNSLRPDFEENLVPSQPAMNAVESYQKKFDIGCLQVDTKVAQAYQNASRGSKEFNLRLMEILAVLCHEIAVYLYNVYDGGLRKPDSAEVYRRMPKPSVLPLGKPQPMRLKPAELFHPYYQNWQQYPHGKADIVGYWAEYRLFGGVVLFDRGQTGSECKDMFIHPVGDYNIFQLSDTQIENYMSFLFLDQTHNLSTSPKAPEHMRFKAEKYARRIEPYDAIVYLNIYRDKYERKIPERRPRRCVVWAEDVMPNYREALLDLAERTERMRAQRKE
ncbi:hypothetical protein EMCG_09543 [[Emmonsia] crescens]|uniref:Uncharacterized protein n=1 Tax=[Emmonsia] crescens TaxID=73230 RepID=A0A0G2I1L1_9EURO|nr:hypothetical protein EMCG_09543 [Emmonsia crescens UAMH 3008]